MALSRKQREAAEREKEEAKKARARELRLKSHGPPRVRKRPTKKKKREMVGEMDVVKYNKFLNSMDEDWYKRLDMIQEISQYCTGENTTEEQYIICIKTFQRSLGRQFDDPRSVLIRDLCDHMKTIAMARPHEFIQFVPFFLSKMANATATRVEIIRNASQHLAIFLAENVNDVDPEYPFGRYIMNEGMKLKQADARCTFIKCFNILLLKMHRTNDRTATEQEFVEEAKLQVIRAMNDAGVESRDCGYIGLKIFEKIDTDMYQSAIETLSKVKLRRFREVTDQLDFDDYFQEDM